METISDMNFKTFRLPPSDGSGPIAPTVFTFPPRIHGTNESNVNYHLVLCSGICHMNKTAEWLNARTIFLRRRHGESERFEWKTRHLVDGDMTFKLIKNRATEYQTRKQALRRATTADDDFLSHERQSRRPVKRFTRTPIGIQSRLARFQSQGLIVCLLVA